MTPTRPSFARLMKAQHHIEEALSALEDIDDVCEIDDVKIANLHKLISRAYTYTHSCKRVAQPKP